jgi:hypothetical protein
MLNDHVKQSGSSSLTVLETMFLVFSQAREAGGSQWLSPASRAAERFTTTLLGLMSQALCCRLLRRLKAKVLKHNAKQFG